MIPRWIGLLLLAGAGGILIEVLFPNTFGTGAVVFVAVPMLGGLASQIYRFRNVSSPSQRQQTKWVVLGFVLFVVLQLVLSLLDFFINPVLETMLPPLAMVAYDLLYDVAGIISGVSIPLSIGVSILRFRLWDVDFVINRTLIYALTTVLLLGVSLAGFFGLRALWSVILGEEQELLAAVLPAIFVTLIFNPTRQRLKHFIDRRLYGIGLNYEQVGRMADLPRSSDSGLGKYRDLEPVGRGGMGVVYRAYDEERSGWVAVKTIHAESGGTDRDEASRRFVREAQAIASLAHPNIVTLYSVEEHNGRPYIVMEYVEGRNVAEILEQEGAIPFERTLSILRPLAEALDYAHQRGIVHRDIKPGNILVESESGRPVLMDFGIARIAALTQVTATGGMVGTLDYIAPEQIQATGEVDQRADVYSLGAMAYQMLTGRLPFQRNNAGATIFAHLMEPPPDACAVGAGLPQTVCDAIRKAMAKKPEERYGSVGAFVAALTG
jgi:serine/threonine-protein kinase